MKVLLEYQLNEELIYEDRALRLEHWELTVQTCTNGCGDCSHEKRNTCTSCLDTDHRLPLNNKN